jgi:hypothetical protein
MPTRFSGWILTADIANATTCEDIAGRWCGDVTDYIFTPDTLTVKFHDGRPANVYRVTEGSAGFTRPGASARPPDKEVFKKNAPLASRELSVTPQAGNFAVRRVTWSVDRDNLILCLAAWAAEIVRL